MHRNEARITSKSTRSSLLTLALGASLLGPGCGGDLGAGAGTDSATAPQQGQPSSRRGCAGGKGFLRATLSGGIAQKIDAGNDALACAGVAGNKGVGWTATFIPDPRNLPGVPSLTFEVPGAREAETKAGLDAKVMVAGEGQAPFVGSAMGCSIDITEMGLLEDSKTGKIYRVAAKGRCSSPARQIVGSATVLVETFELTTAIAYPITPGR